MLDQARAGLLSQPKLENEIGVNAYQKTLFPEPAEKQISEMSTKG
jgi:hypothetical protein